jgi:D-lyxose ketol-isomerase
MITQAEYEHAHTRAKAILEQTGLVIRPDELAGMEVADFGLSEPEISGAQILTLVDTDKIAAKLLVMLPGQTEPEHTHIPHGAYEGKEETIRCEWGVCYLYGPGDPTLNPQAQPPAHRRATYTVWHEYVLHPGDQVTLPPNSPHWFQGGPDGCVIWSFSTKATDARDVFTDPEIVRQTVIVPG